MLPKLKISSLLLKRLEQVKQQCSGCLFGVFYGEGTLLVMGFNVESTIGQLNYEQIQYKFPAELDLCGLVKFGHCTDSEAHLTEIFKDVDITDNPILLNCELGTLVDLKAYFLMHGKLEQVPYEVLQSEEIYRDFCFTRINCSWNIYTENNPLSVRKEIHALRKAISGGSLAFNLATTNIFITNGGAQGLGHKESKKSINNDSFIRDMLSALQEAVYFQQEDKENSRERKNKKSSPADIQLNGIFGAVGCDFEILNIDVLRCKTKEFSEAYGASKTQPAMAMCLKPSEKRFCIPIDIESLAILSKATKVGRLYDVLIESICRALRLCEQSINEHLEESEANQLMAPKMYNFFPAEFGHFISCCYLDGLTDYDPIMQDKRKRLHRHFGLPVTRPYFRRNNACIFRSDIAADSPLFNTHIGLKPSGVKDGKLYLVQGNYRYYHYLQQKVLDNGWGCAYRSLQTIYSWFLLQGYTQNNRIPTHLDIQQYLVRIGDKPKNFQGSSQWIGSTEVGMCLQGMLDVECKIQHCTTGAELSTIASDLAMHFQTQGTPIMIGGGVLAHTIIGIDYCVQTGQVKFLILDPHYTGEEDLAIIQAKGWCGWKGIDFWDKKSYYNLCMPQRPIMF